MAIEWLPIDTKRAMLDAIEHNRIIVGAYTDRDGGVCPMLAAHRNGGRTSFASFARAWDRYTKRRQPLAPRDASASSRTLRTMLEAASPRTRPTARRFGEAIAQHRELQGQRAARRVADTGERNRTPELRKRHGWAWTRLFRRYEDYEAAMAAAREPGQGAPWTSPGRMNWISGTTQFG